MSIRLRKIIASICFLLLFTYSMAAPMAVHAQGLPVIDAANLTNVTAKTVLDKVLDVLKNAALIGIKNAMSAILSKLAYDAAVYIASAGTGQESLVFGESPGLYAENLADAALGGAIEGFATAAGMDAAGLCNPGDDFRINLTLGLDVQPGSVYKPACTLTELAGNWKEAYSDPKFSDFVELQFDSTANPLGISLEAQNLTIVAKEEARHNAELERLSDTSGFAAKTEQVSGTILTPGTAIKSQLDQSNEQASSFAMQTIGNPVVDAINVFASTLISKLMQRAQDGLANLMSGSDLSNLLGGSFSGTVSGRAAAEARYATLKQPTFSASGSFDVLSQMTACPEEGTRSVENCTIGSVLQTAINDGWNVQEFIDYQESNGQSFRFADNSIQTAQISNSEGVNQTGITVLKKYRVVPVGWQVAAEYISESADAPTLKQLADCYNYCGSADEERSCDFLLTDSTGAQTNYSPYCKLVDPYWVLKAPQNFCEREAPGVVIADVQNFDDDSNEFTQESLITSRLNYCADSRGCIQEEQEGVCTAYGYCTEEKRIYRFDGETCDEEYSSCQLFTDEDGNDVSYVKSTVNYNDCATDPGCQWYCLSTNDAGEFDCASPTETYISCSEDVATNEANYGLSAGSVSYNTNEQCTVTSTQTCTVGAGSDSGDNNGDGLIDYRECLVSNTDGSSSICTLDDNCGASNSTYNTTTSLCTCTVNHTGTADLGATYTDITVEDDSGADATERWYLEDEDGDGSADACSSSYSTYANAPVCEVASAGILNCGDVCYTSAGGTCTNSLGNTCTDGSSSDTDGASDGDCTLSDICSIANGSYTCTSDSGNTCVLGTQAEDPNTANDTLYFDANVETCDSSDADCNQYIRIKPDTNLIPNALFDYYDVSNTINDSDGDTYLDPTIDGDDLAFCTHNGNGCATDANCVEDVNGDGDVQDTGEAEGQCIGWIQTGVTAYVLDENYDATVVPDVGTNYIQIDPSSTGNLSVTVDTGHSLADRTLTFAYRALSNSGTCSDVSFTIGSEDGADVSAAITADPEGNDYEYSADWADYTGTYTFNTTTTDTAVTVAITPSATCEVAIQAAALTESDDFSGDYSNYALDNVTYLNGDTVSCDPSDVGCELYVEDGKDEANGIPGIITNPNSDDCVDASGNYNYDNPSCSQCNGNPAEDQSDDYFAGCDFYQEVALDHTAPITTDEVWLNAEQRAGAMQRSGRYCEGDSSQHCFVDADCGAGSCIEEVSIVPESGTSCSAAAVGCEAYTNLASVEEGGEGLEYYTQLQQCVRTDDQSTAVFYTFEGSDSAGVAVEDHLLKVDQDSSDSRPCANLDLSSEEYNADCADSDYSATEQATWDCGPDGDIDGDGILNNPVSGTDDTTTDELEYGTDADCRQYVTATGDIFYRYESDIIIASDDCTPLRNQQDTRVYFAIPEASNSCSAAEVSCREYKGTDSGSERTIVSEDFSSNETTDWPGAEATSNESILQSGYSLQLQNSNTTCDSDSNICHELFTTADADADGTEEIYAQLEGGNSYVISFWAETTAGDGGTLALGLDFDAASGSDYYFTETGFSTTSSTVTLDEDGDWHQYTLGPVILPEGTNTDDGDEYLKLKFTGDSATSEAYIDTIVLTESNSQYVIQDSARTCNNFEGCREYTDRAEDTHYLKSFLRLCGDDAVGCEAMLATQNSSNPFTEAYNLENEYDQDDVIVPHDQPVTLVYDDNNVCSGTVMGCTEVGMPTVDEQTGQVEDYQSEYYLNQPDRYDAILCEQPQLACSEYSSDYDGTVYFKDPGNKLCELKEYTDEGNTFKGWFVLESTATTPDCPLQNDFTDYGSHYASQPLGGVCNSNSVHHNDDGTVASEKVGAVCNADTDCYPDDWTSSDARPRCISNLNDDVDVYDGGVHQYIEYADDGITLTDVVSNFGWVGVCPGEASGCSEYVDPYSPNIKELNKNWSFEDDIRNDDNVYYATDETVTGFPDYWHIPYNITLPSSDQNGDGVINSDDGYTEVDIDNDNDVDFDSTCTSSDAVITTVSGAGVNAFDGSAALGLGGNCVLEQSSTYIGVEPDKTYTIQGMVKMTPAQMDAAEFSIGIHFYTDDNDNDGVLDMVSVDNTTLFPVADHATIASEDATDTDSLTNWYRFEAYVGVNTTVPIPTYEPYCLEYSVVTDEPTCSYYGGTWIEASTAPYAAVFIANNSSDTIYFDAVSFKESDKYYYLDYTVDGTSERELQDGTNTCLDQDTDESTITSDGGCVAFRDSTSDTLNYSQDGLDCTTCLLSPNSDACRYIADACDTNSVLQVKKDRVCDEWLSCQTSSLVTDEDGSVSSQCFAIERCTALDEDGNCSSPIPNVGYDNLSASSDTHYNSAESDTDELSALRDLTGYSRVGLTWNDVLYCNGGPNDGVRCDSDTDCENTVTPDDSGTCSEPYSTEGYYPFGWMTEIGESGSSTGEDLIELRDFEDLYCAGGQANSTLTCINNATEFDAGHCYDNDLKQKVEGNEEDDLDSYQDVVYLDSSNIGTDFSADPNNANLAFCPNSPNFNVAGSDFWPFGGANGSYSFTDSGWQPLTTDTSIFVTQYENFNDCPEPCEDIDLNNVLQIGSSASQGGDAFSGGVQYDLQDNVIANGTYALTFDGRYVDTSYVAEDEGGTPSTTQICLRHDNIGDSAGEEQDRKDCFVNGFGEADIVFVLDSSGTMAEEIAAVQDAVPDLATQLSSAGIDARFALVDMDDNDDDEAGDDGDGCSPENSITDANYIDLDFTSDIDEFTAAVAGMTSHDAQVDNYNAIYQVATNSFNSVVSSDDDCDHPSSLTYRSSANKYLVQVTDIHSDEISNGIGATEAQAAAIAANLPVFVVGDFDSYDNYQSLTQATGGDSYNFTQSDNVTTYTDWATNTDIIDDLFASILDSIDIFQMDTTMQTYSLGPITINEKDIDVDAGEQVLGTGVASVLEFVGSDGASFQIDNISLLPVLEVNKDLNPIGRTCRAYPESDSRQCVYAESNGTQYQGWKGYCLEMETSTSSSNDTDDLAIEPFIKRAVSDRPARCITWWPVDVLEGEQSIVEREPSGYTGQSSVYHCLVSKGLEHPGFCEEQDYDHPTSGSDTTYNNTFGQGVICSADSDCGGFSNAECFQGANYILSDTSSGGVNEHNNTNANFTEALTTGGGQCEVIDESDTTCNSWSSVGSCSEAGYYTEADCTDAAVGGTWSEVTDLLQDDAILETGNCVDIANGQGLEGTHYNDAYTDPQDASLTSDSYCFYDVDGASGNEVRSTRSCSSDATCQSATTSTYYCASMTCNGGDENKSCGYHDDESDSQCASVSSAHVNVSYETRPLRWQMPDPAEESDDSDYSYEKGVIVRLPANEILRNIHASEMEVVEFNPGSAGKGGGAGKEYPFWGQLNGDKDGSLGIYDTGSGLGDRGNIWLTDLLQGAIEVDEDGNIVDKDNCYAYKEGDQNGFGCRMWGLYDNNSFLLSDYEDENLPDFNDHGLDLVYQWIWGNFDYGSKNDDLDAACNVDGGNTEDMPRIYNKLQGEDINEWFDSDCVEVAFRKMAGKWNNVDHNRNVWKEIEGTNLWNDIYVDYDAGATDGPDMVGFDASDLPSDQTDDDIFPSDDESDGDLTTNDHDGGNIMSLYVDFNDAGYIQAVYVMLYFAARGTEDTPFFGYNAIAETTFENMMHLDIQTRESCALVAESVSSDGTNAAWSNRASTDSDYDVNFGEATAYGFEADTSPYGAISVQEGAPPQWDHFTSLIGDWPDTSEQWGAFGFQPTVAALSSDIINAGHPLTCLGECDDAACVANPEDLGEACSEDSCEGICMGIGDAAISNEGTDVNTYTSLDAQIAGTVDNGSDRLKHLFANIETFYDLTFTGQGDAVYEATSADASGYWDDSSGDNLFTTMTACNGDGSARPDDLGEDTEYCGVYPTVTSIVINDEIGGAGEELAINNGQTITMEFTTNVDGEQTPLDQIYIDWGDGNITTEAWQAAPTTHVYTHSYSCGPENTDRFFGTYCEFTPKITVTDNWGWCSGLQSGYCTNLTSTNEEACTDDGGSWLASGANHRYFVDEGQSVMLNCGSYDVPTLTLHVDATT